MNKQITIKTLTGSTKPGTIERLAALMGRLPEAGEVWVLFCKDNNVFSHIEVISPDNGAAAFETASEVIAKEFAKADIMSAEVYVKQEEINV